MLPDLLRCVQAGLHQDAAKLAVGLESQEQSLSLQIAIKYEQNDIAGQSGLTGWCLTSPKPIHCCHHHQTCLALQVFWMQSYSLFAGCKRLLEKLPAGSSDGTLGAACLLYKEGNHEGARKLFTTAMDALGYQPELAYNIALCYYQVKQYGPALKHIAEIIERGVREHPELSVGAAADGAGVRSVGNSQVHFYQALIPLLHVWPYPLDNSLTQLFLTKQDCFTVIIAILRNLQPAVDWHVVHICCSAT